MANPWFRFKQFTVHQERSAFKVGTDGVLLGAWADVSGVRTALDIGTGTGLLALMLAQRSAARITAIEIDLPSYEQALENIRDSPWPERTTLLYSSLQEFKPEGRFDLVISNPPFFQEAYRPSDSARTISRHDKFLQLDELAASVPRLLREKGKFCLILPAEEGGVFGKAAGDAGLFLHRETGIRPTPFHPVKRCLMEYRLYPADVVESDELVIEKGNRHEYTERYRELTGGFYLAF